MSPTKPVKPKKPTESVRPTKQPATAVAAAPRATAAAAAKATEAAKTAKPVTAAKAPTVAKSAADALGPRALNRATLARQMLLRREKLKPRVAIERLLCLQAQIARPPFLALWSRLDPFRREDLIAPIDKRELVRSTMMRATIHLMARQDYLAFRPVIQPVLSSGVERIFKDHKQYDTAKILDAARTCFAASPCNFVQLRTQLLKQFPKLDERGMGYIVRMHLPLILMPQTGCDWAYPAQADFMVAESWLGEPVQTDAAAHAFALRYLAAFGPASVQDFQSWTGLGAMKSIFEDLRPKLRTFRDERGRELFDLPNAPRPSADEEAPVRFLPEYDHVLLGYAERPRIIADAHRPALQTKNLIVPAIFLVDGFIAGLWTMETKKGVARMLVKPLITLSKPVRNALTDEGGKLLPFIEPDAKSHVVDFER